MADFNKVVCEGQNRNSDRILWGDLETVLDIVPKIVEKVFSDFDIKPENVPKNYREDLFRNKDVLPAGYYENMKMFRIRDLSLQEAIDFAILLLRLERDMQKYTENIPTVGGNIKIAVIGEKGFKFLHGDELKVKL